MHACGCGCFLHRQTRLSIHNLPRNVDDKQLRNMFLAATGRKESKIQQAKIVRSSDRVDAEGNKRSKGFGFVEFESHEV